MKHPFKARLHSYFALLILLLVGLQTQAQDRIKIACVGNSITEGYGLKVTYPQALQQMLGDAYEVRNFGLGGRTLLKQGDHPYWNEDKYKEVLAWQPDIVIIKLGTNDTKPQNWKFKDEFVPNYVAFVNSFKALPSEPKVFLALPMPAFEIKWGINGDIVKNEVIPAVKEVAKQTKAKTIDLYTPFLGKANLTYDQIHPNEEGVVLLASEVFKGLPKKKVKKKK
ncbi:GDSL-type esterase/lipase family protein [Rufibacter roseus]|uniref:GDSL-type esterase/lipase family protein n=1 Tax=Rufibacter roseus TaxID=1567108 RepID=A0ABW2DIA4_9BACT|nr:GDSL-type esterase/lipase family protein [Rufibacter roseus]